MWSRLGGPLTRRSSDVGAEDLPAHATASAYSRSIHPVMFDKLRTIETRYDELMRLLSDGAVQSDPNQYRTHSKALSEIQPIVEKFRD